MNKFGKTLLTVLAANIGFAALFCLPMLSARGDNQIFWLMLALIVVGLVLFIQLIIGIIFTTNSQRKEVGKAMLGGVGILLLIGLSICGGGMILG